MIGPGFTNVDFTFVKEAKIGERLKTDFRAEFFNILNCANFGLPLNSVFNSNGSVKSTSGSATRPFAAGPAASSPLLQIVILHPDGSFTP